jgi:hypothetical protein
VRREGKAAPPPATTEIEDRAGLAQALVSLGVRGELVLHDGACGEARLALPGLERRASALACAPTGARSPDGRLVARCIDGRIEVFSATSGELEWFDRGCIPAWRPNRELTAARAGAVVRVRPCSVCTGLLVSPRELERAARLHPAVPTRIESVRPLVDGIAWLSNERAAISMSVRLGGRFEGIGPVSLVAFFAAGRLDATTPYFRATGGRLAASPRGRYVTLTPDVILRPDGSQVSLPPHLRDVRDFAWSPDERFLALATRFSVVVVPIASLERYDRTGGGLRSVTIPQAAAGLAWR